MAMILHLGVLDIPYVHFDEGKKKKKKGKKSAGSQTTGDVAEWLEDKYHIMQVFALNYEKELADDLAEAYRDSLETYMLGGPLAPVTTLAEGTGSIEDRFKKFLSSKEIESMGIPGVPTLAAIEGVNHRMKGNRGPPNRPSFIDTGQYEAAFKAWVDGGS